MIRRKYASNQTYGLGGDVKNVFFKEFNMAENLVSGLSWSKRLFCRSHSAAHVCQISNRWDLWCEGAGRENFYSATMWPIVFIFYVKHYDIMYSYGTKFHVSSSFQLTAN